MNDFITAFSQIIALIGKELLALIKDPANRVILFAPALMQSILFGYGATYDLNHVPYAVFDASHSQTATELVARLDGSSLFKRTATLSSTQQISEYITAGHAVLVLSIPADFEQRLNRGQDAPIQLILDGRNSSTAAAAMGAITTIVAEMNAATAESVSTSNAIQIERRIWHNANLESRWAIMPALIAALSLIQTLMLSALSVAREREQGTFDQLLVTPLTPLQILIGKAIPAVAVGTIQSTLIFLIIRFWFQVPMAGSIVLLYLGIIVFNIAVVGMGLSISAIALTMQQAMLYAFLLIMPLMLLSGLLAPIRNMPDSLQLLTWLNPLRFGIIIVRGVYLEGAGLAEIGMHFIPLLAMAACTLPLAAWLFRNRLS